MNNVSTVRAGPGMRSVEPHTATTGPFSLAERAPPSLSKAWAQGRDGVLTAALVLLPVEYEPALRWTALFLSARRF